MVDHKGDIKIIQFVSLPNSNIKLSEFESNILAIIKKLGQASVNDILIEIKPDYYKYPNTKGYLLDKKYSLSERLKIMKHLSEITMLSGKLLSTTLKLKEMDCIRVNRYGYQ